MALEMSETSTQFGTISASQRFDLLRVIVLRHRMHSGKPFMVLRSPQGDALFYERGQVVRCIYDDSVFERLRDENLLSLSRASGNQLCGTPTELGIKKIVEKEPKDDILFSCPFLKETKEYDALINGFLLMKENLAFFHATIVDEVPPEGSPDTAFYDHGLKIIAGAFDAIAESLHRECALTDSAAQACEEMLTVYEEFLLNQVSRARASGVRASFLKNPAFDVDVKMRLKARRQYWIGQTMKKVREHKETIALQIEVAPKPTATAPMPAESPPSPESNPDWSNASDIHQVIERRARLLAEYKAATDNPPNQRIYEAPNAPIHKPEF
jgi:hypothetical protein